MKPIPFNAGLARGWALALLALSVLSCARRDASPPSRSESPRAVRLIRVTPGSMISDLVFAGRVRAKEEVTLSATVGGRLTALPFAEGRAFRAGSVLARFESPESRLGLDAARAAVRAAAVRLEESRRQEARIDSLWKNRVVTPRDLDVATSEARIAEAAHEEARARAALLEFGMLLRAPFDGVVVRHVVDAGVILVPGSPVLVIRSSGGDEIEVPIPESQVERVRVQRIVYRAGDGPWRPARLARLEGMTDYASRTRVAYLEAARDSSLDPGAYVEVRLESARAAPNQAASDAGSTGAIAPVSGASRAFDSGAALRVPASCVVRRGELTGVFVAREGHARLRWVRLGRVEADAVEVLAGLWAGEQVVRDPDGLSEGRAIEATP
jgi:RND family efflux transporter MFP subunit